MVGFINREEAEKILISKREQGSFLVRFSDSEAGTVSIPFSYWDSQRGTYAAKSGSVSKAQLTCKKIGKTIDGVKIVCGPCQIILSSVCYMEITGANCEEEWKSKRRLEAFPVGSSNPDTDFAQQRYGYVKFDNLLVGNLDEGNQMDMDTEP